MTTDIFPKIAVVQEEIGGKTITLAGITKGSGMIHPNMATMLCFIVTDALIAAPMLRKMLTASVCTHARSNSIIPTGYGTLPGPNSSKLQLVRHTSLIEARTKTC